MLFSSFGWFDIMPAVIELLLCCTAVDPATVTFSIDRSFAAKPYFSAWCIRYDIASSCYVSPRPVGFYDLCIAISLLAPLLTLL
jgi:hypothetical protein